MGAKTPTTLKPDLFLQTHASALTTLLPSADSRTSPRREFVASQGVALGAGILLLGLFGFVFSDFVQQQIRFAWAQPSDWGHTLIIPIVSGYFIWLRRGELSALQPFVQCWLGLVPVLIGVAWYMLCVFGPKPLYHHNIMSLGPALTLFGSAWLLFGTSAMRWLWFPLAFSCVFGQTVSEVLLNKLTFQLQDIAAVGAQVLLVIVGTEVERSGNTLTIWSDGVAHPLNVAEACSGMRMLVAFLALGVFLAYTNLTAMWQQILLVALGVPIAILVNIIRVASIGILTLFDANFADGEFHELVGVVWMLPALFLYLGTLWAIRHLVVPNAGSSSAV